MMKILGTFVQRKNSYPQLSGVMFDEIDGLALENIKKEKRYHLTQANKAI